jgi:hypothetical protein
MEVIGSWQGLSHAASSRLVDKRYYVPSPVEDWRAEKIAKDEEVEPIREYPVGTIFADPIEDAVRVGVALADMLIYRFRVGILGREPIV